MNYLVLATSVQDIKDEIGEAIQNGGDYDYIQLIQQTSDVSRVLSVVYGVLVTVILILVPIIVSLELMYICFPLLRVHMESFVVKVESKGIAGKVVGFTLRDAREAVYKADTLKVKMCLYDDGNVCNSNRTDRNGWLYRICKESCR